MESYHWSKIKRKRKVFNQLEPQSLTLVIHSQYFFCLSTEYTKIQYQKVPFDFTEAQIIATIRGCNINFFLLAKNLKCLHLHQFLIQNNLCDFVQTHLQIQKFSL